MCRHFQRTAILLGLIVTVLTGCAGSPPVANGTGESFVFDVPENRFRIHIPDLPPIPMQPHPLAGSRPDMRYFGADSQSGYSISVLTPTADQGMSPEQCASSSYRSLLKRYGLNEKFVIARKNNPTTFVVLFPHREGPLIQLKAYVLSGYNGDHCIDVHISKNASTKSEEEFRNQLTSWYQSFSKASIEHY